MKRIITETGHIEVYDEDEKPDSGGKLLYPGYNNPNENEFPKQEREVKSGSGGIMLPPIIKGKEE